MKKGINIFGFLKDFFVNNCLFREKITLRELIILNVLVYTEAFQKSENIEYILGKSVYDFINDFDIYNLDKKEIGSMDENSFLAIVNTAREEKNLFSKIKIANINNEQGVISAIFEFENDAIFVFRGTSGSLEWNDNREGIFENNPDTKQQVKAYEYFEKNIFDSYLKVKYKNVYVTGHSKGGNKAQYIGVRAGRYIKKVYSFDGQGFGDSFFEKYKENIKRYSKKIVNISGEYDYVNIIGELASSENIYLKSNALIEIKEVKGNFKTLYNYHFLTELFHIEYGKMIVNKEGNQADVIKEIKRNFVYYKNNLNEEDYKFLGSLITSLFTPAKNVNAKMPKGFIKRFLKVTNEYNGNERIIPDNILDIMNKYLNSNSENTNIFDFISSSLDINTFLEIKDKMSDSIKNKVKQGIKSTLGILEKFKKKED